MYELSLDWTHVYLSKKTVKVHRGFDSNTDINNPAITVGMIDGVHLGHRSILNELIKQARKFNGESVVITFWPHPRSVVSDSPVSLLNTLDEKLAIMQEIGIDHVFVIPFTREFSDASPEHFIKHLLFENLHFKAFIVGYDHHFGKNRSGDFEMVNKLSESLNFKAIQVPALQMDGINISSTKIRQALLSGEIVKANKFLGYPYSLSGTVIKGERLGHQLGFPTANLKTPAGKLIPANGVYAVKVLCRTGKIFHGMVNIGTKPTVNFDTKKLFVEVHLFNFSRDIYGETITLSFIQRIRDERKFTSTNELKAQIEKDKIAILQTINH